MALINWDDSFSVGVKRIDDQHQKLVSMINELSDAMRQGKGKDVLGKIVTGLVDYTVTHFSLEEKLFVQVGYGDALAHKKTHEAFVAKVKAFKEDFDKGRIALSVEVMNFLSDWLKTHIKGTDKQYSTLFIAKGIE